MQALKKSIRLSAENSEQKSTFLHQTNDFQIEKTINMWAEVFSSSALNQNQYYHILIKLNSYFMIDLVFILFVKFLDISLCMRKKHQHVMSDLKDVSEISFIIYKIYYLRLCIIDYWNHSLKFIWFFIIVDHNIQNSQILLDKSVLKNFKINIYNNIDSWKFEWKFQMTEISLHEFIKKLISITCIFEV